MHLVGNDAHFEVGNYLGGGAAGTVYEAGELICSPEYLLSKFAESYDITVFCICHTILQSTRRQRKILL